ncbi:MAG: hypothetical protein AAFR61_12020 [Bacteroidota bacterium]
MDFNELKDMWQAYDEQLDQHTAGQDKLLKTISLKKAKGQLWESKLDSWLHIVLYAIFANMVLSFTGNHLTQWQYLLPAVYVLAMMGLEIGYHLYRLIQIRHLDYGLDIREAQTRIHRLILADRQYKRWLWLLIPTFFLPLMIITAKGLLGLNAYLFPWLIWGTLGMSLMAIPIVYLVIWLARDRKIKEVKGFLAEIARFSQEA